jgi:FkbM family methyltransferase
MVAFVHRHLACLGKNAVFVLLMRRYSRWYREGSVAKVRYGYAKGLLWKRYKRYVNGYWRGDYELPIQKAVFANLKPAGTFFDVGASAGFFTLLAGRCVGGSGKCVALEPVPDNITAIQAQIELNGMTQCHVVEAAVSKEAGWAEFAINPVSPAMGHLGNCSGRQPAFNVRLTTLDQIFSDWGPPDLVKLDIEGAEALALEGGQALLQACHPKWIVEVHGQTQDVRVTHLLSTYGYHLSEVEDAGARGGDVYPRHIMAI